ncbi:hypothetical protein QAD02_014913 [Eretmocerus hayati]|uniref:Uncharacterized protein n=1 Tax=Eretmocerus hayati TaxID=131215 RepID=A0ACC2P819_9HYME|nr:hypothetical protein QAD02_014913 [Eretmocerus hayati]
MDIRREVPPRKRVSFTPVTGSLRDYQYASGSYLSGKPAYSELESASFITSGGSPYAKSDTHYLTETIGDGSGSSGLQSPPEYLTNSPSASSPGSVSQHQLHHYYPTGETQSTYLPHYKTYVMSGGASSLSGSLSSAYPSYSSYSSPKYQSVLGALKSLFVGPSESLVSSPSHHHPSLYSSASAPSSAYFSSPSMSSHATAYPSSSHSSPGLVAAASAPNSHGFYYTPGSSPSGSPYAKSSLPSMRFVSGYGVPSGLSSSGMSSSGSKYILVRDTAGAHSSIYPSSYPATPSGFSSAYAPASGHSSYPSSQLFSPSSVTSAYIPKTKYAYPSTAASMPAAYYAASPSSMNYASGPPSSAYPSSFSSSPSFPSHGGSPFLGYST